MKLIHWTSYLENNLEYVVYISLIWKTWKSYAIYKDCNCLIKYVLLFTLQVKYTQDHKQMKGRPSLILDTPGLRYAKEAQNHISMVGYNQILLLTTKIH